LSVPLFTRREFVRRSLAAGVAPLAGFVRSSAQPADPFAGGVMIGTRPLFGRGAPVNRLGTLTGTGLDARLFTDLSTLSAGSLITSNERFFLRTAYPDLLDPSPPWALTLGGLVRRQVSLPFADLARDVAPMGTHLLECAGNNNPQNFGLMSAARWAGVPIARVLERAEPTARNPRILISGVDAHSRRSRTSIPGASWIFAREELERFGAFLATEMNGVALSRDHGFPVRLVVPRWYGCACIKWVNALEFVPDDALATPHMQEFAARTFQAGQPERARDYTPAVMGHSATPVRVEKWVVGGRVLYRVVGILWGGADPSDALAIRFRPDEPFVRVDACAKPSSTTTWTLWWHAWRPPSRGRYDIVLRIDDPKIRSPRLDVYYYARAVDIDEV
jgi:DMSO/TMAO reductase YedYZ molybdopterin-dependent catalytic subunit